MQANRFAVTKGPDKGRELAIPATGGGIGRGPWNALRLADPEVSRSHCRIEIEGDRIVLVDAGSRSGTWVNGQKITRHVLLEGDEISLGRTCMIFHAAAPTLMVAPTLAGSLPGSDVLARRYEILGLIGVGGMGSVYKVRDRELDEVIALKVLRRDLADSVDMQRRFRHEVKLARRVTHRNVARIFDIGEHRGERFLTMELVDGESLNDLLARRLVLSARAAVDIALELCAGLTAAHRAGVVHRDLKPDNILIAADGRVVITDFGIAFGPNIVESSEHNREVMGTPAYVAPEVLRDGVHADGRADLYSLGAVLFEMVTGVPPWSGDNPAEVAMARLVEPPPNPRKHESKLSEPLVQVIMRCMARERDERYRNANEVAAALRAIVMPEDSKEHVAPSAIRPERPERPERSENRQIKRVAVLPFHNASAEADAYLAEGTTGELIDFLSMTPGLRVCAHSQVELFAGRRNLDIREAGRALDVDIVVVGVVERADAGIRISARLINVVDGFQLWAKRFEGDTGALLSITEEAAQAIAQALTVSAPEATRKPMDPMAIDLYLRGRRQYRKLWQAPTEHAVTLFEQALARVPNDPSILAGCALARARLSYYEGGDDTAVALAEKAVALAPNHADTRLALASARFQASDLATAVIEARHAVSVSPGLAEAHYLLGRILLETGPIEVATQCLEKAIFLDAHLYFAYRDLARAQVLLGYSLEAARVCLEQLPDDPSAQVVKVVERARMAIWRRNRDEAVLIRHELISITSPPDPMALRYGEAVVGILLGDKTNVQGIAEPADFDMGSARRRSFMWQLAAELYAYMGQAKPCVKAIGRAVDAGMTDLVWMDRCPILGLVRDSERFRALREVVMERATRVVDAWQTR